MKDMVFCGVLTRFLRFCGAAAADFDLVRAIRKRRVRRKSRPDRCCWVDRHPSAGRISESIAVPVWLVAHLPDKTTILAG